MNLVFFTAELERNRDLPIGGGSRSASRPLGSRGGEQRQIYTLHPESFQRVSMDMRPDKEVMLCSKSDWPLAHRRRARRLNGKGLPLQNAAW